MSRSKQLSQLIEACEKHEFDKVVKNYLKVEYNYKKVVNRDGKSDMGLDIRVFDFHGAKNQYQLTIQKSKTNSEKRSFERKLREDIEKASRNHLEYGFSNKLFFFYSYEITPKRIMDYEKEAYQKFNIELTFFDAKRLAQEAENIIEIQKILYDFNEISEFQSSKSIFPDEKQNLVYDLLTFGKSSEFKLQIIEAFILNAIFSSHKLNRQEIITKCEQQFSVEENEVFYSKLLSRLQTTGKVTKTEDKSYFELTSEEFKKHKIKIDQYEFDKNLFLRDVKVILSNYSQEKYLEEYILMLKELYTKNFNSDLQGLNGIQENGDLKILQNDFTDFISKHDPKCTDPKRLGKELLLCCMKSKFIQKIAASMVYCQNINDKKLQSYLTTQKKVFIDTSIGLHALCYFYKPKAQFDNYYYQRTKNLIDFFKKEKMDLHISEKYIHEIQNHIKESISLLPFSRIDNFSKLGTSNNVFYNHYLSLVKNESDEKVFSFDQYLEDFGFFEGQPSGSMYSKVSSYLEHVNIKDFSFEKRYEIYETNNLFTRLPKGQHKHNFTLHNDSLMVEFLADSDVNIHPLKPLFITWDKAFFELQKKYFELYNRCQKWLMMYPSKLIDTYAVLKFSIDEETVTEDLLAHISDELIKNSNSLIDAIKFILNPEDEIGLEYTNMLASIREKELYEITNKNRTLPKNIGGTAVIDDVVFELTSYFRRKDENEFNLFKEIFTRKEFFNNVIENINNAVSEFYNGNRELDKYFDNFESIINKIKKEK